MTREYTIELDGRRIGTTALERHDAPMGCVLGNIKFEGITSGYSLFKEHCLKHSVIADDQTENKCLMTQFMPGIRVLSPDGIEIKGVGIIVTGMDDDVWEIDIMGVPYPFYEEQFPHHVKDYQD